MILAFCLTLDRKNRQNYKKKSRAVIDGKISESVTNFLILCSGENRTRGFNKNDFKIVWLEESATMLS